MSSARNTKEKQIFCALNVSCQLMTLPPQYDDIKDRENDTSFVIIITVPVGHCLSSIAYSTTVQCSSSNSSSSGNKKLSVFTSEWDEDGRETERDCYLLFSPSIFAFFVDTLSSFAQWPAIRCTHRQFMYGTLLTTLRPPFAVVILFSL